MLHVRPERMGMLSADDRRHIQGCLRCTRLFAPADIPPLPAEVVEDSAFVWPEHSHGRGGMAEIFFVEDRRLPRLVAIKLPRSTPVVRDALLYESRIRAEADVLARLQHPNIVTLYEVGRRDDGRPFLVLERIEGEPLRARLDRIAEAEPRPGDDTEARLGLLASLLPIAEALVHAHARGIVHRDITPNNILLAASREPTLIDWGIAKRLDATTLDMVPIGTNPTSFATAAAGTVPYMPVEQTRREPPSAADDIYNFGMVLYEVISGRLPYAEPAPSGTDEALEHYKKWVEIRPDLDPASKDDVLAGVIAQATAPSRAGRFTAEQLLEALRQYLSGALVFSHRYSVARRVSRWIARHRVRLAIAVAVTVVAVSTTSWVIGRSRATEASQRAAEADRRAAEADRRAADADRRVGEADKAVLRARQQNATDLAARMEEADRAHTEAGRAHAEAGRARTEANHAGATLTKVEKDLADARERAGSAEDDAKRFAGRIIELTKDVSDAGLRAGSAEQRAGSAEALVKRMTDENTALTAEVGDLRSQLGGLLDAGRADASMTADAGPSTPGDAQPGTPAPPDAAVATQRPSDDAPAAAGSASGSAADAATDG